MTHEVAGWVEDVAARLSEAFGSRLLAVVLFGSSARGEAGPSSDVDLLVVATGVPADPVKRHREARMALMPLLDRLAAPVNLVVQEPEELLADLTPLLLDVCVDGVCLVGASFFEPLRSRALEALAQSGLERRHLGGTRMWVFPSAPPRAWTLSWEGFHAR